MIETRKVCCCGAVVWAFVIGWLESIGCGLAIVIYYILFALEKSLYAQAYHKVLMDMDSNGHYNRDDLRKTSTAPDVKFYIILTFLLIRLLSAIILVVGVKQKNLGKVKVWLLTHLFFAVVEILGGVALMIVTGNVLAIFPSIVTSTIINVFCIWVVNLHRKELFIYLNYN